jgi:hypothetical protein
MTTNSSREHNCQYLHKFYLAKKKLAQVLEHINVQSPP